MRRRGRGKGRGKKEGRIGKGKGRERKEGRRKKAKKRGERGEGRLCWNLVEGGGEIYGVFPLTPTDVGCGVFCQGIVPFHGSGIVLSAVEIRRVEDRRAEIIV